jgi:hypothetical protein
MGPWSETGHIPWRELCGTEEIRFEFHFILVRDVDNLRERLIPWTPWYQMRAALLWSTTLFLGCMHATACNAMKWRLHLALPQSRILISFHFHAPFQCVWLLIFKIGLISRLKAENKFFCCQPLKLKVSVSITMVGVAAVKPSGMASRIISKILLLLLAGHVFMFGMKPAQAERKAVLTSRREDIPFIRCRVCEIISKQLVRQVKDKRAKAAPKKVHLPQTTSVACSIYKILLSFLATK